ncbi:hypothetical protein [Simkania sp.]|uniref:hypothetical protein n=1 Tax=Simkania sp. TaxID=34094 RepID=UPI003B522B0A
MEPIDTIDTIPLQEGIFNELEEKAQEAKTSLSFNTALTDLRKGCGATRRRALSENFGGLRLLPPKYQTKREMKAIRESEEIKNLLNGQDILSIRKVDGAYLVLTEEQQLHVKINYSPNEMPGPAKFKLNPGQPEPR